MAIEDAYLLNRHLNKGISLDDFTMLQDLKMYGDKSFVVKKPEFLKKIILLDDETILYDCIMTIMDFFDDFGSAFNYIFNTNLYTGKTLYDISMIDDMPVIISKFLVLYDFLNNTTIGYIFKNDDIKLRSLSSNEIVGSEKIGDLMLTRNLLSNKKIAYKKSFYKFLFRFLNLPLYSEKVKCIGNFYKYEDDGFKELLDYLIKNNIKYKDLNILSIHNNETNLNVNVRGYKTYDIGVNYLKKITKNTINILTNEREIAAIYPYFKDHPSETLKFLKNGGLNAYLVSFYNFYKNGYDNENDIYIDDEVISEIMKISPIKKESNSIIPDKSLLDDGNILNIFRYLKNDSYYIYNFNQITKFYLEVAIFKTPGTLIKLLENYNTFECLLYGHYNYDGLFISGYDFSKATPINRYKNNITKEEFMSINTNVIRSLNINGNNSIKDIFNIFSQITGNKKIQENLKKTLKYCSDLNIFNNISNINARSSTDTDQRVNIPFIILYYIFKDTSIVDYFFNNIDSFKNVKVDVVLYSIIGTEYGLNKYLNLSLSEKKRFNAILNNVNTRKYFYSFFSDKDSMNTVQIISYMENSTRWLYKDTNVGNLYNLSNDECLILLQIGYNGSIFITTRDYTLDNISYENRGSYPTKAFILKKR